MPSGSRNLFKNSRDFSGTNWVGDTGVYAEDYQGVKIFKKQTMWGGRTQYFEVKTGEEYVFSAYVKSSAETDRVTFYLNHSLKQPTATGLVGFDSANSQNAVSFNLTDEYQRIAIKIRITLDGWIMPRIERFNNDAYLFFGGYKLEKGETATPYNQAPEDLGWSTDTLVPTQAQRYLWKFDYIYYSDGSVEITQPVNLSIAGADADTTGVTAAIEQTNQTVAGLQNSVSQAQSDLATVSSNLTQARQDLEDSVASVNAKAQAVETTLAQVQSTANANSQRTATLENNLDGLNAKFSSLKIGGTNLLLYSADPWQAPNGHYEFAGATKTDETLNGSIVYKTRAAWSSLRMNFGKYLIDRQNVKVGDEFTYSVYVRTDQETPIETMLFFRYSDQSGQGMTGGKVITQEWQRLSTTFKLTEKMLSDSSKLSWVGFEQTSNSESGKYVYYACNKLERGNIATDYSPNQADLELKVAEYKQTTDQNYASLQSTVQALDGTVTANKATADQTAQGFSTRIESLETYKGGETTRANQYFESAKTETARQLTAERTAIAKDYVAKSTYTEDVTGLRNDLTATTTTANTTKTNLASYQASNDQAVASLQSSLQTTDGNVSSLQTQINAVPGQITTAVSAVEGKIPTGIGAVNLFKNSRDFSGTDWVGDTGVYAEDYQGVKIFKKQTMWGGRTQYFEVKTGEEYVFSAYVKSSAETDRVTFYLNHSLKQPTATGLVGFDSANSQNAVSFDLTDEYQRIAIKIKITSDGWIMPRIERYNNDAYLFFGGYKLERGNLPSDWSPAPEDTASQISSLSSQIQQTADGMTLLATKTELNTAKTDLQVGITTATSKADSAQATANSNAQTISTHTTQISALNTGLQSKVSQSDFDSLSGDVDDLSSELTQTASSITASVSSVEAKADNAQTTANSAVSKANAAQTAVNTLDGEVVKSASLNLDNNGFVTKVGKTIDGNKFATMIAQNANNVKIIANEMQVTADMIVDGAVTAEKLDVNNLSAVTANLGDMTSGSITNTFASGTRSGSVKIGNGVEITTVDTSGYLPEKAKTYSHFSDDALSFSSSTSNDEPTHSMMIMPEMISYTKHNYDNSSGGTGGWTLRHNGHYSMLEVDMVWQNVRLSNTSELPYGVRADYVRIGNLVTISVNRQITNIATVAENQLANETIPEGFRPISQAHLTLTGNTGSTIDATCIVHLNPDGTIRFTNNKSGNRVWTGTVTYTCVEAMPYSTSNNNISTI